MSIGEGALILLLWSRQLDQGGTAVITGETGVLMRVLGRCGGTAVTIGKEGAIVIVGGECVRK